MALLIAVAVISLNTYQANKEIEAKAEIEAQYSGLNKNTLLQEESMKDAGSALVAAECKSVMVKPQRTYDTSAAYHSCVQRARQKAWESGQATASVAEQLGLSGSPSKATIDYIHQVDRAAARMGVLISGRVYTGQMYTGR